MESNKEALKALDKQLGMLWKPQKRLNVWKWAEENVYIPAKATPIPGKYSTDKFRYVRGPMEAWSDKKTKYIVLNWAAQSTKTTCELVCLLYDSANYTGNIIFQMPSDTMARSKSETVLQPIINSSPTIKALKPRSSNKFKITEMHMQNGTINLIGGNSASNLASRSAGRIYTDEVNKLKRELTDEADPLSLLFERCEAYMAPKIFLTSTPTVPTGHIRVWFDKGSQEYFHYPCPHCAEEFTAKWPMMKWDKKPGMSDDERARSAYLECPNCKEAILNKHKRKMMEQGRWIATNPQGSEEIRSFHFNRIMSPLSTFQDMVVKWLQAVERSKIGELGEMKNFINSALSEDWIEELGKSVTDKQIEGLIDPNRKRGMIPKESLGLVAGVDTQDNGFYWSVRAFGKYNESWLIAEGFVETLSEIEQILVHGRFGNTAVAKVFIDCQGHRLDEVYRFCRKYIGRVMPCVGRSSKTLNSEYTFVQVDKSTKSKIVIGGLERLVWNTTIVKDLMFAKMKLERGKPGSFHIHNETSPKYRESLKSEFKNLKGDYEHIQRFENHWLDTEALCFIGARILGIEYWNDKYAKDRKPTEERGRTKPVNNNKPW